MGTELDSVLMPQAQALCPGHGDGDSCPQQAARGPARGGRVPVLHSGEGGRRWLRPAGNPAASRAPVGRAWCSVNRPPRRRRPPQPQKPRVSNQCSRCWHLTQEPWKELDREKPGAQFQGALPRVMDGARTSLLKCFLMYKMRGDKLKNFERPFHLSH